MQMAFIRTSTINTIGLCMPKYVRARVLHICYVEYGWIRVNAETSLSGILACYYRVATVSQYVGGINIMQEGEVHVVTWDN